MTSLPLARTAIVATLRTINDDARDAARRMRGSLYDALARLDQAEICAAQLASEPPITRAPPPPKPHEPIV